MKSFQKKSRHKIILQSRFVLFLLGFLIVVFSWSMVELAGKMQDTIKNRRIAENKALELQIEKENLLLDIANLNTSKGIEESIRDRFGLAKEGEEMIIIVEDKNLNENVENSEKKSFFPFLKNLFKNI